MYRPKFCAECNAKIIRLRWHFWTSRRFCDSCAPRFLKEQVKHLLIAVAAVFLLGMAFGQAARKVPPPLVIERSQNSILTGALSNGSEPIQLDGRPGSQVSASATNSGASVEEIYTCGARTRKGTACTRRVHGPVRCWQHSGLPAMLPQEQLRIKAR